jgi:hypothetical protein
LRAAAIWSRLRVSVLIFWLLGFYPVVLLLTWAVTFYLTVIETRQQRLDALRTLWWLLLVFFTHFAGYLALRAYVFYQRRAAT